MNKPKKIAVIGSGVSGIVSSYLLSKQHQVDLYETADKIGGHTSTVLIDKGPDAGTAVDTGFIVCNNRTYPHFHKFLDKLGVPVRNSDMSFGFYDQNQNYAYAGTNLSGLFAQRKLILSPTHYRLLIDIARFSIIGLSSLKKPEGLHTLSLGEYLKKHNFNSHFIDRYLVPISAAIWSTSSEEMLSFPVSVFLNFYKNHGLLELWDRPQWQTVQGGSHSYLKAFQKGFKGNIHLNQKITGIKRPATTPTQIEISFSTGTTVAYDAVVIAVHADQVLPLLTQPTPQEKQDFSPWEYQKNHTILHTDASLLPPEKRAWASWNFLRETQNQGKNPVSVSYDMNRLQGLNTQEHYLVSLNLNQKINDSKIIKEFHYEHPTFTVETLAARENIRKNNGQNNTYYVGSYFGFGFHEDAVLSAVQVAQNYFGITFDS